MAALELMSSERDLSLRRIAAKLQTGPASLYAYYANTTELYADVVDRLFGSASSENNFSESPLTITALLWSYSCLLVRYPQLARSAVVLRPSGKSYLKFVDQLLKMLLDGGASKRQAAWGVDLLLLYATSIAAEHSYDHRDSVKAFNAALSRHPLSYPNISCVGSALMDGSPRQRFDWAVGMLLSGIMAEHLA